jgi:hypothetical protein
MQERKNWGKIAGLVLHILIGGLLIFTGSEKVLGLVPPEALAKYGLGEQVRLIGAGALLSAILLLIPRTSWLGVLLTSSFWGGAICTHMAHGEPYLLQAVLLVLSWVGAYLRKPATLSSLSGPAGNDVGGRDNVGARLDGVGPAVALPPGMWHHEQGAGI